VTDARRSFENAVSVIRSLPPGAGVPRVHADTIREHVDIVRRILPTVELTAEIKGGVKHFDRFVGRCPFCRQAVPSFEVIRSWRICVCHACGCGGDVFRFVMVTRGLGFRDTVLAVAEEGWDDDCPF
jgi:DNA primase